MYLTQPQNPNISLQNSNAHPWGPPQIMQISHFKAQQIQKVQKENPNTPPNSHSSHVATNKSNK